MVFVGIETQSCTTILVPGWAAIIVMAIAAAPRLAKRLLEEK